MDWPKSGRFTGKPAPALGSKFDVYFDGFKQKIVAAVLERMPFPLILSKGWVESAKPKFIYVGNRLDLVPSERQLVPSFKTNLSVIPEEPKENVVLISSRGSSFKRTEFVNPGREDAPQRPRQIALLVSQQTKHQLSQITRLHVT